MKEQENVIPLEIKGSVTVYPQSYVDELNKKIEKAKEIIKEYYDIVEIMLLHHKIDTEKSVKLEVKAEQFLKEIEK